jgi:hypothetical protein
MTNSEVLANCGLFFIAALGYAIITGIVGLFLSVGDEDSMAAPSAWLVGCLMYAITVVHMWQG